MGLQPIPQLKAIKDRRKRGLGPLTPDEKYLGNVVSEGFSDFVVMFVVTFFLLLTLYCLNPVYLAPMTLFCLVLDMI